MAMLRKLVLGGINMNRGSVTIMAIGVMMFLGIILSGVLPMITQEVRSGTMNRDVVEAQYAAEAGLKRTIAAMQAGDTTWNWLGAARGFTGAAGKSYTVNFVTSGVCKTGRTYQAAPANGTTPASGWYCLQSVGIVNGATKTVSVAVEYTGAGLTGVFANGVFGSGPVNMNSSTILLGSLRTNSGFTGYKATINGDLIVTGTNNSNDPYQLNSVSGTTTNAASVIAVPTFSTAFTMPSVPGSASSWPNPPGSKPWNRTATVGPGTYKTDAKLEIGKSKITVGNNSTIYVSNGLELNNASTFTLGDGITLYVYGDIKLSGGSRIITQGTANIYVSGSFQFSQSDDSLELGGNTNVFIGSQLTMSNGSSITTAPNSNVVFKTNSISMSNSAAISSGADSSLALLAKNTITMSNITSITKALVMAEGDITMTGDGPTSIIGSVISTKGTISMYNARVTYDQEVVSDVLTNNVGLISGSGTAPGSGNLTPVEWNAL